jgi:acetyltransferase-like isoleucine patch superfamily enzyme
MNLITLDDNYHALLSSFGINILSAPGSASFPANTSLEPPCSLKWLHAEYEFSLGAFSYAVSGYFFAVKLGRYCSIGEEVQVGRHSHPLDFGSTSPIFYLEPNTVIGTNNHPGVAGAKFLPGKLPTIAKHTEIKNDVYIGHGAFIMPGVVIGNGAVIGARSVVTKDVPDYAVVAGSPARIVKYRFNDAVRDRLLASEWWKFSPAQLSGIDPADPSQFISKAAQLSESGVLAYSPDVVILGDLIS